jgi:protein-disulfide isomerase
MGVKSLIAVAALALLCASSWGQGQKAAPVLSPINVVKLISFNCATCYQSETLDPPIRRAVLEQGGKFVIAPIPRLETDSRERFYYALRDLGPEIEEKTRQSLFKGSQDLNYPLADAPQVLDWLSQDLASLAIDWNAIVATANGEHGADPVARALDLASKAGAQVTPTYVLVRDGVVLSMFDINTVPNTNLSALREAVLNALKPPVPQKR